MQMLAYEVRISDWSSDVCSSYLRRRPGGARRARGGRRHLHRRRRPVQLRALLEGHAARRRARPPRARRQRSEEHTSELQSLMRISYAVFCLKKKKQYHVPNITTTEIVELDKYQQHTATHSKTHH